VSEAARVPSVTPDPAGLVARCLSGDDTARAEFINTYDTLLQHAVRRRLNRYVPRGAFTGEAEDIRHEIYLKLFAHRCKALDSVRNAHSMEAWLVVVAQNHTVSYMRKRLALEQASADDVFETVASDDHAPDREAIQKESWNQVRAALDRLEDKDRLVLQLYYLYNHKYAEIAETLGMNINTVASRLMRAKEKVREFLVEADA
jgi:RNA polymerase sigma-70 factor (ECF subfamily)